MAKRDQGTVLGLLRDISPAEVNDILARVTTELGIPTIARHPELPGITVEVAFWTRHLAEEALAQNVKNRTQRSRRILSYYRNMVGSQWPFTGDSVCFDRDGHLIDGQHRCEAILKAAEVVAAAGGDPDIAGMWTVVVRGLDPDVQNYKDIGAARSTGDQLSLQELPYANRVAGIARWVVTWRHRGDAALPGAGAYQPTSPEVQKTALGPDREDLIECARLVEKVGKEAPELRLKPRVAGMALWLFLHFRQGDHIDKDTGRQFMEWLLGGAGLGEEHPVMVLRQRLTAQGTRGQEKLGEYDQLAFIIQAWNLVQSAQGPGRRDFQRPAGGFKARTVPAPLYIDTSIREAPDDTAAEAGVPPATFSAAG